MDASNLNHGIKSYCYSAISRKRLELFRRYISDFVCENSSFFFNLLCASFTRNGDMCLRVLKSNSSVSRNNVNFSSLIFRSLGSKEDLICKMHASLSSFLPLDIVMQILYIDLFLFLIYFIPNLL